MPKQNESNEQNQIQSKSTNVQFEFPCSVDTGNNYY